MCANCCGDSSENLGRHLDECCVTDAGRDRCEGEGVKSVAQPGGSAGDAGSTHRENGVTITDQPFFISVRGKTLDEVQG